MTQSLCSVGLLVPGEDETFLYISDFEIGLQNAFDLCNSLGGQIPLHMNEVKLSTIMTD